MPSSKILKLKYHQVIRRVCVEEDQLNFQAVKQLAKKLFEENKLPDDFVFKYKDEDDDLITVSSQTEFEEAVRCLGSVLRLMVIAHPKSFGQRRCKLIPFRCPMWSPLVIDLHNKSLKALQEKNLEEAKKCLQEGLSLVPRNSTFHYNLACAYALEGNKESAIKSLQQAIDCGYSSWAHMKQDPDLESIRNEPQFTALIEKLQPKQLQVNKPNEQEILQEEENSEIKEEEMQSKDNDVESPQEEKEQQVLKDEGKPNIDKDLEEENQIEEREQQEEKDTEENIEQEDTHEEEEEEEEEKKEEQEHEEEKQKEQEQENDIELRNQSELEGSEVEITSLSFGEKLKKLEEMGFSEKRKNIQALLKHGGNLTNAIQELIQ